MMDDNWRLEMLRKRGKLVKLDMSDHDIMVKMIRTDQRSICPVCEKEHRDHPYIENLLDWDEMPYLHYICDGRIVKL